MKIGDIIKKILAGETLTDDEKTFLGKYDEQALLNSAAAAARRESEAKARKLEDDLKKLQDESKKTVDKKDADYNALAERVKALETANAEGAAKLAKIDRAAKIKAAFDKAGIKAAKGVSEGAFQKLVDIATENVDVDKEESIKTAIESFKAEYSGVIAAEGAKGTGRTSQNPSDVTTEENPWAKGHENITKQCEIALKDPAKAEALQKAAAAAPDPAK